MPSACGLHAKRRLYGGFAWISLARKLWITELVRNCFERFDRHPDSIPVAAKRVFFEPAPKQDNVAWEAASRVSKQNKAISASINPCSLRQSISVSREDLIKLANKLKESQATHTDIKTAEAARESA